MNMLLSFSHFSSIFCEFIPQKFEFSISNELNMSIGAIFEFEKFLEMILFYFYMFCNCFGMKIDEFVELDVKLFLML